MAYSVERDKSSKQISRKHCFVTSIKRKGQLLDWDYFIRRVKQKHFSYIVKLNVKTSEQASFWY